MCGGDAEPFAREKVIAYARCNLLHARLRQLAKVVNQMPIAGIVQGLAEGLSFAKHAPRHRR
jgi:3-hydroxyisobutyrate dehydrogenase-like beta-hydroxyacid dehydrogenase